MRKIISFNMVTLDGFFEGPNHDISWHNVDQEFNQFAIEQTASADGLIFGRVTYEMMAGYWPGEMAKNDDPIVASQMNNIPKIVFSRTLEKVEWNKSRLIKEAPGKVLLELKQQPGRDLFIFGSANLSSNLTNCGIIDEYRIIVSPLILGSGSPLFKDINKTINLKLLKTRVFKNGNVLLYYQPVTK